MLWSQIKKIWSYRTGVVIHLFLVLKKDLMKDLKNSKSCFDLSNLDENHDKFAIKKSFVNIKNENK